MHTSELPTPALLIDLDVLDANIATMAAALPGPRLRPHVKAHKCTSLAARQAAAGHAGFTCATIREVEGMAAAGLGADLLLANEVLDATRLGAVVAAGHRVTVAVDSDATVDAAAAGGVREVLVDVNVGLPRCGCDPADVPRLAERARALGLHVRGVMGYEGHAVGIADGVRRRAEVEASASALAAAAQAIGAEVVSGGGTGSWDLNAAVTELQAGSYVLMDTAYGELGLPFGQALFVLATVISAHRGGWVVADAGLKAFGMDHGDPRPVGGGDVWFTSDEHLVWSADPMPALGDRVRLVPAHCDPTVAYHAAMWAVRGDDVVDRWPVDLRGW
ncbi:MAG TPA: alanine racemase [Acidimicrobiales bacterium]|nr:alanine racemase [Acidimicrobiales bacterium]